MAAYQYSLGSDKPTIKKQSALLFYIIASVIIIWILFNDPLNWKYAVSYMFLYSIFFSVWVIDFVYKATKNKRSEIIDTITEEPVETRPFAVFRNTTTLQYGIIIIIVCIITAFSISSKGMLLVSSPQFQFQLAPFLSTPVYGAILSGLVAVPETLFFFGFVFPTAFAGIMHRLKSHMVALLLAFLFTASTFTLFHFLVYGTANIGATIAVFIFGLRECIWVYLFRSLSLPIAEHFTNNFIAEFFETHIVGALF